MVNPTRITTAQLATLAQHFLDPSTPPTNESISHALDAAYQTHQAAAAFLRSKAHVVPLPADLTLQLVRAIRSFMSHNNLSELVDVSSSDIIARVQPLIRHSLTPQGIGRFLTTIAKVQPQFLVRKRAIEGIARYTFAA